MYIVQCTLYIPNVHLKRVQMNSCTCSGGFSPVPDVLPGWTQACQVWPQCWTPTGYIVRKIAFGFIAIIALWLKRTHKTVSWIKNLLIKTIIFFSPMLRVFNEDHFNKEWIQDPSIVCPVPFRPSPDSPCLQSSNDLDLDQISKSVSHKALSVEKCSHLPIRPNKFESTLSKSTSSRWGGRGGDNHGQAEQEKERGAEIKVYPLNSEILKPKCIRWIHGNELAPGWIRTVMECGRPKFSSTFFKWGGRHWGGSTWDFLLSPAGEHWEKE